MIPTENCYAIIKQFEGLSLKAYEDSGDVITIGYGHTGEEAQPNNVITAARAEELLIEDVKHAVDAVNSLNYPLSQNQFDALISLVFNCGLGRLQRTYPTLLKTIKINPYNYDKIETLWLNTAVRDRKGNVLRGLQHRRKLEFNLYKR